MGRDRALASDWVSRHTSLFLDWALVRMSGRREEVWRVSVRVTYQCCAGDSDGFVQQQQGLAGGYSVSVKVATGGVTRHATLLVSKSPKKSDEDRIGAVIPSAGRVLFT